MWSCAKNQIFRLSRKSLNVKDIWLGAYGVHNHIFLHVAFPLLCVITPLNPPTSGGKGDNLAEGSCWGGVEHWNGRREREGMDEGYVWKETYRLNMWVRDWRFQRCCIVSNSSGWCAFQVPQVGVSQLPQIALCPFPQVDLVNFHRFCVPSSTVGWSDFHFLGIVEISTLLSIGYIFLVQFQTIGKFCRATAQRTRCEVKKNFEPQRPSKINIFY